MAKDSNKEGIRVLTRSRFRSLSHQARLSLAGSIITSWGRKGRRSNLVARTKHYVLKMMLQKNPNNQTFKPPTPKLLFEVKKELIEPQQTARGDNEAIRGSHASQNNVNYKIEDSESLKQNALQVYRRRCRENVVPFFQHTRVENFNFMRTASQHSKGVKKDVKGKKVTCLALGKPKSLESKIRNGSIAKNKNNNNTQIVPCTGQGALIPIKKMPSLKFKVLLEARVDLDKDTMREWERLMETSENEENEENEDAEVADKYKEKWEKERELFKGRIVSFISRMHLIQGNRRFSPWKGSVVDSVAGVFLTQNVSDNLSSSAFMSLTARYPNRDISGESSNDEAIQESSLIVSAKRKDFTPLFPSSSKKRKKMHKTSEKSDSIGKKKNKQRKSKKGFGTNLLTRKTDKKGNGATNRDNIRKSCANFDEKRRPGTTSDAIDWRAVRTADVDEVSKAIAERGMDKKLAERIKNCLNLLNKELGNIDLEWLRNVPPEKAKEYLSSIFGLGLKSVECIRLLTLQHQAFPVDTNVGRILVRLGWVPIHPLPNGQPMHLLKKYPHVNSIHKYLWPRLCTLDYLTLYELHNQMITFGKVFCTKVRPNCNACPMRAECRHFASAFTSASLTLPVPQERSLVGPVDSPSSADNSFDTEKALVTIPEECGLSEPGILPGYYEQDFGVYPILDCIESTERDIEDLCLSEVPTIKIDNNAFMENLMSYMEENRIAEGNLDLSKALVVATPEVASIPLPKWKNISRLRTEHQVYELPDTHPLLNGLEKREPGDPCPYLLAIRTSDFSKHLEDGIDSCNSKNPEYLVKNDTIQGTILIPCRTATKGRFPLNGTYFQVNEVFADYESSKNPKDVPRAWIWNLRRKTLYCGTSINTIFRGMSTEDVQRCFWRGYVCLRGFNRETRRPMSLPPQLHLPLSKTMAAKPRKWNNNQATKREATADAS